MESTLRKLLWSASFYLMLGGPFACMCALLFREKHLPYVTHVIAGVGLFVAAIILLLGLLCIMLAGLEILEKKKVGT